MSPGVPSCDCPPELAVYVGGPAEGVTRPLAPPLALGLREDMTGRVDLIALTCVVSRCVPTVDATGNFPAPAAIEAAAKLTLGDVWAIWNVVPALYRKGAVFARADGERLLLFFDPASPISISGGAAGWQIPIRCELPGYRPPV